MRVDIIKECVGTAIACAAVGETERDLDISNFFPTKEEFDVVIRYLSAIGIMARPAFSSTVHPLVESEDAECGKTVIHLNWELTLYL